MDNLLLCCSMDLYRGYSFLIEESISSCGFVHVSVVDESILYACSYLDPIPTKGCTLLILTGKESSFISCVSFHPNLQPLCVWKESTSFSEQSVAKIIAEHCHCSEEAILPHLSTLIYADSVLLSSDTSNSPNSSSDISLTSSVMSSAVASLFPSLQTDIDNCVNHCRNTTKSILQVIVGGNLANPSFLQHIRSSFPCTPVSLISITPSLMMTGCCRFLQSFYSNVSVQEWKYDCLLYTSDAADD